MRGWCTPPVQEGGSSLIRVALTTGVFDVHGPSDGLRRQCSSRSRPRCIPSGGRDAPGRLDNGTGGQPIPAGGRGRAREAGRAGSSQRPPPRTETGQKPGWRTSHGPRRDAATAVARRSLQRARRSSRTAAGPFVDGLDLRPASGKADDERLVSRRRTVPAETDWRGEAPMMTVLPTDRVDQKTTASPMLYHLRGHVGC